MCSEHRVKEGQTWTGIADEGIEKAKRQRKKRATQNDTGVIYTVCWPERDRSRI